MDRPELMGEGRTVWLARLGSAERSALADLDSHPLVTALPALRDEPPPVDAAGCRDLWALHGVTGDELSTTVLVAGFAPAGSGAFVQATAGRP